MNYSLTIKCIQKGAETSRSELAQKMVDVMNAYKGQLKEYVYERDSVNRWHIHATFRARKNLYIKKLKIPFWHIHIDPLATADDLNAWTDYIRKGQPQQEDKFKIDDLEYCFL